MVSHIVLALRLVLLPMTAPTRPLGGLQGGGGRGVGAPRMEQQASQEPPGPSEVLGAPLAPCVWWWPSPLWLKPFCRLRVIFLELELGAAGAPITMRSHYSGSDGQGAPSPRVDAAATRLARLGRELKELSAGARAEGKPPGGAPPAGGTRTPMDQVPALLGLPVLLRGHFPGSGRGRRARAPHSARALRPAAAAWALRPVGAASALRAGLDNRALWTAPD